MAFTMNRIDANVEDLVRNLHQNFTSNAAKVYSEIPDVTDKARVQFSKSCVVKDFSNSIFSKLSQSVKELNRESKKMAERNKQLKEHSLSLKSKLDSKRQSALTEIVNTLQADADLELQPKSVTGSKPDVEAFDFSEIKDVKERVMNIVSAIPNLRSELEALLENSKETMEAVNDVSKRGERIIEKIEETTVKDNAEKENDEVSACVELAEHISSSLDRKRGIKSLYDEGLLKSSHLANRTECETTFVKENNENKDSGRKKRKTDEQPKPKPIRV